ncbi:LamG domain-containing protein [Micromonospora sp. LHW51205]|uniref:LamG domain-containing protein n=1 Tax=Micromonospora sp. LHW51205 TaxID=2248752 RepID=UPI0011BF96E1|nr:LamG domain-containing protein [Micromonospora sp. LHW51205]
MNPDIRVRAALDSDPADPSPAWTDITSRVHYGDGGQEVRVTIGRQDEQADVKPTEMSWAVRNGDNAMTPNNSASPYAGRWEQGRRVQIAEVVGGNEYLLGTGFLEIPDMQIVDPRSSQPVTVSAVDWMGRLESAPTFEGTLAEHIRSHGGPMVLHFPLTDPGIPMMASNAAAQLSMLVGQVGAFPPLPNVDPEQLISPASLDGPPGDDQSYPQWLQSMSEDGLTFNGNASLVSRDLNVQVASGQTIAVTFWAYLESHKVNAGITPPNSSALWLTTDDHDEQITVGGDPSANIWRATVSVNGGAPTAAVSGRQLETEAWRLVTVRYTLPSGAIDFWVGADVQVTATTPSPPGSITFNQLHIGYALWKGSLGHVQVRVGPAASTMPWAEHLAQHRHGYRGLDRQTVAERIVTLAGYAGVPATEVVVPEACSTPMQAARLAGLGPAEGLRRAATTGQDILITDGAGRITAVPRSRRYNQAIDLAIPFGWVGYRGLRYRPDKPVTDVTVTRTGGGAVRRSNRALALRYGVTGQQYELDSSIDSDPANLASWALAAFGQSRTRAPSIRINMLRRTLSERQQLLALKVGSRIQITGLPAGSPDDVGHLIVQGIDHTIGPGARRFIQFNTSPLLGPAAGQPPAGVMVGDLAASTAVIAY